MARTPASEIKLPPSFRVQAIKAVLAVIAFVIVYLLLFAAALALAAACMYGGFALITGYVHWITLLFGAGLIGLGVLVCIFLIKFLFETNKEDISDSIEITDAEQPKLVAFIRQVAEETGAPKPKKIFITTNVNASVFYNSGFWSMFLPVKKNLKIGLGLVNALNIGEFKAVVAHEFGHFSQRSMKVGSFVYNVNRVIFNMLYKNTDYNKTLQGFAKIHVIFYVFAQMTAGIATGIQWVLRRMYRLVNICYLGLSRQMEFHADLVAASVSGSNNIISSLLRIEAAEACFQTTLNTYDRLLKENKKGTDLYADHRTVMQAFAAAGNYETENGLPVIPVNIPANTKPRVNVKNQWASHPTTAERHAFLEAYGLSGERDTLPAWSLVENADKLKEQLTEHVYRFVGAMAEKKPMHPESFAAYYDRKVQGYILPAIFAGYFNDRDLSETEAEAIMRADPASSFTEIFTAEAQQLPGAIRGLTEDITMLKAIEEKQIDTRSFDHNGIKYRANKAGGVRADMESDLGRKKELMAETDRRILAFAREKAKESSAQTAEQFETALQDYFDTKKSAAGYGALLQNIVNELQPIYTGGSMPVESINRLIRGFKNTTEKKLKDGLRSWLDLGIFKKHPDFLMEVKSFIAADYSYFVGRGYLDAQLKHLNEMIYEGGTIVNEFVFEKYKMLLTLVAEQVA